MKHIDNENILFCDNHVLVVDKRAGIATQPELTELAKLWVKEKFHKPGAVFLHPIHRLDSPASGIVVFARTTKALSRLQQSMRERKFEKTYHAWISGEPVQKKRTLKHQLKHGAFRAEISQDGKEAVLEYEVVQQLKERAEVRIRLHTGRYHQIRLQLSTIGHPILGDVKYGSPEPWGNGIALCATDLTFPHPVTHQLIVVQTKLWRVEHHLFRLKSV